MQVELALRIVDDNGKVTYVPTAAASGYTRVYVSKENLKLVIDPDKNTYTRYSYQGDRTSKAEVSWEYTNTYQGEEKGMNLAVIYESPIERERPCEVCGELFYNDEMYRPPSKDVPPGFAEWKHYCMKCKEAIEKNQAQIAMEEIVPTTEEWKQM